MAQTFEFLSAAFEISTWLELLGDELPALRAVVGRSDAPEFLILKLWLGLSRESVRQFLGLLVPPFPVGVQVGGVEGETLA